MKRIWKYELDVVDEQIINMPYGAKPLSVDVQSGAVCLWVQVEDSNKINPFRVRIIGTGQPLTDIDGMNFVGTFQMYGGSFVGHVFIQIKALKLSPEINLFPD